MIFLNCILASALAIASKATKFPAFTGTDADATKESLASGRSSLPLLFADVKKEVGLLLGIGHGKELQ